MCERNQNKERSVGLSVPPFVEQLKKRRKGKGTIKDNQNFFSGKRRGKSDRRRVVRYLYAVSAVDARPRPPHSAPLITACLMRAQDGRTDGRTDRQTGMGGWEGERPVEAERGQRNGKMY